MEQLRHLGLARVVTWMKSANQNAIGPFSHSRSHHLAPTVFSGPNVLRTFSSQFRNNNNTSRLPIPSSFLHHRDPNLTCMANRNSNSGFKSASFVCANERATKSSQPEHKVQIDDPSPADEDVPLTPEELESLFDKEFEGLSMLQRYKKMIKNYWYVTIPVHGIGSISWFGSCYLIARAGVDVIPLLHFLHVPENIVQSISAHGVGYFAVAVILYKLVSPLRYMTTLAVTLPTVKYLGRRGLVKRVPTREEFRQMIKERKDRKSAKFS